MEYIFTVLISLALGILLILLLNKATQKKVKWTLRIVSIVFCVVYFFRMVKDLDVFDAVVALNVDAVTALGGITRGQGLFFIILRCLTMASVIFCIVTPWYSLKIAKNGMALLTPIVVILNIIFLKLNFTCFIGAGNFSWSNIRVIEYILEMGIMGGMSAYYLFIKIRDKDWDKWWEQVLYLLMVTALYSIAAAPMCTFTNLFGDYKINNIPYVMDTLDKGNRAYIYAMIVISFIAYLLLRKKSFEVKHFALTTAALASFVTFFYTYNLKFTVTHLPLHLCNAGIVLMVFSFALNSKPLFYFNFLINVLGAAIALIAANTGGAFTSYIGVHYWYTHAMLCSLPCVAVALKVFPRPTFKMVKGAISVFTVYFLLMCFVNPLFCNFANNPTNYINDGSNPIVDYFYLMSDFIPDKFELAKNLKRDYAYSFKIGELTFWTYPVMWAGIYAVYVAGTFGVWYVYDFMFKTQDHHYDMEERRKKIKADLLGIENAGKINNDDSEPLNKEGKGMIKFKGFTKIYGNAKVKAVDNFSLEIYDGEVFGFIGHNGAGKSTAIKSLVGIQSITEGSIEVCGYDIAKQPLPAKKLIGYVPDNHAVYERLTGKEYINYVADLYRVSKEDREERLEKYLNLFKLKDDIDRQIKGYSHGMKQKIVVIAALIHQPKVWVLDEPLTGLDPTSSFQIKECLREHADKGNIVFFSSHVIEVVEKICDRIAIIAKGKLQCVHSIKDLKEKGITLEQLYMQYVQKIDEEILLQGDKGNKKE